MKLNFLYKQQEELIQESFEDDDSPVQRPIGISEEDFTPEFAQHLQDIKKRKPDLYKKIVQGH